MPSGGDNGRHRVAVFIRNGVLSFELGIVHGSSGRLERLAAQLSMKC